MAPSTISKSEQATGPKKLSSELPIIMPTWRTIEAIYTESTLEFIQDEPKSAFICAKGTQIRTYAAHRWAHKSLLIRDLRGEESEKHTPYPPLGAFVQNS